MWFQNAQIFTPNGYVKGSFRVQNGIFTDIIRGAVPPADRTVRPAVAAAAASDAVDPAGMAPQAENAVDLAGAKVLPGLVDIHTHGNSGTDFSDADPEGLVRMAGYLARHGITSFTPTSLSLPPDRLLAAFRTAKELYDLQRAEEELPERQPKEGSRDSWQAKEAPRRTNGNVLGARVMGIHMEGPFFSADKKGSQNGAYLRNPDFDVFKSLFDGCGGLIRIVDAAPELPGAALFTAQAKMLCTVSAAHTGADYEAAKCMFEAGCTHLTHLFNAMPGIHHRAPGVIGAASERDDVAAELICDGLHVHPSAVRMAFKLFPGRICLISDALRCCGMPDGEYEHGGQVVHLSDGIARLQDGTIAGSAANLFDCLRNAVRFGIPEEEAIRAAAINPAKEIGAADQIGSIEKGKYADFLICDSEWNLKGVFIGGICVSPECSPFRAAKQQ